MLCWHETTHRQGDYIFVILVESFLIAFEFQQLASIYSAERNAKKVHHDITMLALGVCACHVCC
jgi:hypothetical protein